MNPNETTSIGVAVVAISCALALASNYSNAQEPVAPTAPVQGVSVSGSVLTEDSCEVLASAGGQKAALREAPGVHVLDRTETHPPVIPSAEGEKISALMCWRSEARLAPNDYLVGNATGLKFYIKTDTGKEATDRTIALEKINGSFRVRLLSGPTWTPAEEAEMIEAMTRFNKK